MYVYERRIAGLALPEPEAIQRSGDEIDGVLGSWQTLKNLQLVITILLTMLAHCRQIRRFKLYPLAAHEPSNECILALARSLNSISSLVSL
jgi:hypothetical protein